MTDDMGFVLAPSPMDRIAELERQLSAAREDLAVAKAAAEQRVTDDKTLHEDARRWREFCRLVQATHEGR